MKKLAYDRKFERLNLIHDDGSEEIVWAADGSQADAFAIVETLINALEGDSMALIYTEQPEKHMADRAIEVAQTMRQVLLLIEKVTALASGNKEVKDLIAAATGDDLIGESGLTKNQYTELVGVIVSLTSWKNTDITLPDSRVMKPEEIVMRGYEI